MSRSPLLTYEHLGTVTVRVPARPAAEANQPVHGWDDLSGWERAAIELASPSLATDATTGPGGRPELRRALRRYRARSATRATPFGLFSAVGTARLGPSTTLAIGGPFAGHAQLGFDALLDAATELESDPAARSACRIRTDPAVIVRNARAWLADRQLPDRPEAEGAASIRATLPVRTALDLARSPILWTEAVGELCRRFPDLPETALDGMLVSLLRLGFLWSDYRPSLGNQEPAARLADQLDARRVAPRLTSRLAAFDAAARRWEVEMQRSPPGDLCRVLAAARAVAPGRRTRPLDVDLYVPLDGTLSATIATEAGDVAAALVLASLGRRRASPQRALRERFEQRYEAGRYVPLRDVTHPEFGLGAPEMVLPDRKPAPALAELADGWAEAPSLELTDEIVRRLAGDGRFSYPRTAELFVQVLAPSRDAIDRGAFRMLVSGGTGTAPAGRSTGRFVRRLGPDAAEVRTVAAGIERASDPSAIWAELTYLPQPSRLGRLAVRPLCSEWELPLGVSPSVPPDRIVPADELAVGLFDGRLRLYWPARGCEVRLLASHLVNGGRATGLPALLTCLAEDDREQLLGFSWGAAESRPRLPRVTRGRTILRPAQWTVTAVAARRLQPRERSRFGDRLAAWADQAGLPRRVVATHGDQGVPLDVDDADHVEELRRLLVNAGRPFRLVEDVVSEADAWLPGAGGANHHVELAIPLRAVAERSPDPAPRPLPSLRRLPGRHGLPPGRRWTSVKLYAGWERQDALIDRCAEFAADLASRELLEMWYFLRYADPEPHVRVRFCSPTEDQALGLLGAVAQWAGHCFDREICDRVVFDTYEPELERYGGAEAMPHVEQVFAADSVAVAEILRLQASGDMKLRRAAIAACSLDDLLTALGLDVQERNALYRASGAPTAGGPLHREHGPAVRRFIEAGAPVVLGEPAARVLARRRARISPAAEAIGELERRGELGLELRRIGASLAHMHANRMLAVHDSEADVVGLLRRVTDGLLRPRRGRHHDGE